jgi:hypothetical protein
MNAEMKKHALRRYIVFRIKAIEFLDLNGIRQTLLRGEIAVPNPVGRTSSDFIAALRTTGLSWLAVFVDKSRNGMDVIDLWTQLFPQRKDEIVAAWKVMEPAWDLIRAFRDRAGFHADKPAAFFNARAAIIENEKLITVALEEFQKLMRSILNAEPKELPELENALDSFLDELEANGSYRYKRDELKRYLMIAQSQPVT